MSADSAIETLKNCDGVKNFTYMNLFYIIAEQEKIAKIFQELWENVLNDSNSMENTNICEGLSTRIKGAVGFKFCVLIAATM